MESVVSGQGTAPSAAIPGYRVAGKTGTAMRFNSELRKYSGYTASFIGFAPADAPKYVISVTIQDPKSFKESMKIEFDEVLARWNYKATPMIG